MSRLCLSLMMIIVTACGTSDRTKHPIDVNTTETSTDMQVDSVQGMDSEDALTELVEDELTVAGPDGQLSFTVAEKNLSGVADYPEQQRLYYRVERDGVLILDWSPLGIVTQKHSFLDELDLQTVRWTQTDRTYETPTGKRRLHREHFNQATIGLQNPDGAPLELEVRVFDDAVAFRYRLLGMGNARITE